MSKASTITYITVGVLLLFLISRSPKNPASRRHRHRRLKLRTSFGFSPNHPHEGFAFDPVVADLERRREDREWERRYFEHTNPEFSGLHYSDTPGHESQPEWDDLYEDEDYLNDEDKFNLTNRLVLLFPKIDVDPTDGFITETELTEWNMKQAERDVMHRTRREMDIHDKNKDGFVSFAEYEPPTWARKADNNSVGYNMGWWKEEHFNASDADEDGLLNLNEFNDFLHPADSKNPKLIHWLCEEEVRERDSDRDGKISFDEFFHGIFDLVSDYDEEDHNNSQPREVPMEAPARQLFGRLDKDGDGYLSDAELVPVIGKIHPSEHYYAKQQADYLIDQVDADKDGRLTLEEMIQSPYAFYSAIFDDDGDADVYYHDEFR